MRGSANTTIYVYSENCSSTRHTQVGFRIRFCDVNNFREIIDAKQCTILLLYVHTCIFGNDQSRA